MKILVVGSGGREHALVWKIAQSRRVKAIFCAPGNAGIAGIASCVAIDPSDIAGLRDFAEKEAIDLTVVGPEAPLVAGIVDEFERAHLKIFGPSRAAAALEGSKAFAKSLMLERGIPTASSATCLSVDEASEALSNLDSFPVVIKADGLAAGKGVVICKNEDEALSAVNDMQVRKVFGDAGKTVVIEEYLEGEEASILALTNGYDAVLLASSQDHKRIFDSDQGPNTGGMGAYSPAPVVTKALLDEIARTIIRPVIDGMRARGTPYRGVLYAGIMVTKQGPKVLEFNVRFGDPETQAVLARLNSDLVEAMLWTLSEDKAPSLRWSSSVSVCVVMASGGYPGPYAKGKTIMGLDRARRMKNVVVFHAGTKQVFAKSQGRRAAIVTNGGRVLGVTGLGKTVRPAIKTAYRAVAKIHFDGMHYRKDIGWRALKSS